MMIIVAAFILQWWTSTLFNIWGIFSSPPPPVLILPVIFINLGGIYNGIAYTLIRRKLQRQKRQNAVVSNGDNVPNTTDTNYSSTSVPRVVSSNRAVHDPRGCPVTEDPYISPDAVQVTDGEVERADSDAGQFQIIHIWKSQRWKCFWRFYGTVTDVK